MPNPRNPAQEHPSTYLVQNQSHKAIKEELARLQLESQMLNAGMGGVMPEQPDLAAFQRVLDIGCGTGDWLIELAKASSSISLLVGVDINPRMVDYARAQARSQHVSDRMQFHTMDALRPFEFPADSFDLVNQRLGQSYVRTWEWPTLLHECYRVSKPGGVIRVTEAETVSERNSPAVQLGQIFTQMLHQAGYYFTPDSQGITGHLARLLRAAGLQNVQTRGSTLEYHGGTVEGERFVQNVTQMFRTALPFMKKWTRLPENYEELYQQALIQMQRPDFVATWRLLTAWGTKPENGKPPLPGQEQR